MERKTKAVLMGLIVYVAVFDEPKLDVNDADSILTDRWSA